MTGSVWEGQRGLCKRQPFSRGLKEESEFSRPRRVGGARAGGGNSMGKSKGCDLCSETSRKRSGVGDHLPGAECCREC